MKVFFSIWILAVLIQEVIPSTLVRLPRQAEKNLSLVHTEYEAKYEQKGKHGNESFSSVSGKQEIVHDNCAENWNSFAEKCASLIKDLVASLANAVSSKPGDATNLQLHIKNTFRHFDNTHNCTCLNHTEKTLSDLNLSPLFKNITINTVGSSTQTDVTNGSGVTYKKCGVKGQPCDENNDSDTKKNKNILPELKNVEDDEKGFDQKQLKENGQPFNELWHKDNDNAPTGNVAKSKIFSGELAEEQKQQNRALVDAEDLDMNPENSESLSDQSTNNSRRQIKYPENLMKPQKISKNSGDSDFKHLSDDPKHSSSNSKRPKGVHYPFLVTVRPNPQSAKPFESPAVALNPPSLSGTSLESDFPKSPEHEPSHDLNPQENSSASPTVLPPSSSLMSSGVPSSASYLLTPPNNENSSLNNKYLRPAPQVVPESHSSLSSEDDPKEEVFAPNNSELYQKPINPVTNKNKQSPKIISEEPLKDYNSDLAVLVPTKPVNNKFSEKSPVVLPEDQLIYNGKTEVEQPVTDSQALNPVIIPVEQLKSDHKVLPSETLPEKLVSNNSNSKSNGQPVATLPESPLVDSSDSEVALPIKPISSELNTPSPVIVPEESIIGSHVLKPEFIPAEQIENEPDDAISSPIIKSTQQPTVRFPEKPKTEGSTSDLSQIVPDNYKSNVNSPVTIPALPVENKQSVAFPEEFSRPKTTKSESSGLNLPESPNNSELPLFIQSKKPTEEPTKEWLFTTPKMYDWDKTASQGNTKPTFTMNLPQEDQTALKRFPSTIPVINSNRDFTQSSEPESDIVTLNPFPTYKPLTASSSSNPSSDTAVPVENSAILSPKDILSVAANEKPLIEETTTIKSPVYKPSPTGLRSKPSLDTVVPGKNSAILSPEDILPIAANKKPFIEEPATTESDQTTEDGLYQTISMMKPISSVPEVANQQSGVSAPKEKQINSNTPSHPIPTVQDIFGPQYSDKEKGKLQYPQQSIEKEIFTTPLPFHPVKTVTIIPTINQQLKPQPVEGVEGSEIHESPGKDFTVTEIPPVFNIPGATKNQLRQPSVVVIGDTQNEEQVNAPTVAPKIEATTPVIIYPVKSLPISPQSPEQSYQESSPLALGNSGFADSNQKSEIQTPTESVQAKPMTSEQQNSNAGNPMQLTASDPPNDQEHPVTYAPIKESDDVQYPQVIVKPDKIPAELIPPNSDHPQNSVDLNSVPSSTSNSEITPVISPEFQPETVIPPTTLKPAQPGVLIQNTEVLPHQDEEQNPLLIRPTTFQTTSEDPTPSQVNISGLLTHTTSVPQDSDETMLIRSSTSPKTTSIYEHDDDDEEDCCSCESCTEEEISDPKQYKETACKNLEEARKELKAIFDKIKKKLKCGRKAPQTIISS